ncbi:MAG: ATP-binding cassette domain-containing protein, partial [Octadecabacter sp.]|nr:ATP-binding cassette domain-containing protein [Octadecabacter sp.]
MTIYSDTILEVKDLQTHFFLREGVVKAVDGVSFRVGKGEILGIVGESGSGKSVTGFSIMGLVNKPGKVVGGHIKFRGDDLAYMSEEQLRMLRGNRMSIIFQDANVSLNPVLRIDTQMIETVLAHKDVSKDEARKISINGLKMVGIPAPDERINSYPH